MSTQLLAPTVLLAPVGGSDPETTLTTASTAFALDIVVRATVVNAASAPTSPCRINLQLSQNGGVAWQTVDSRTARMGAPATTLDVFELSQYSEQAPWTHFRIQFTGNRGAPVTASVDVDGGAAAGGSGSVTSVAITAPSALFNAPTGGPITAAGTIDLPLKTQNANTIFAGPSTGVAATPGFRTLVAADIPAIPVVGGWVSVANIAARNAIANGVRTEGMVVTTQDDDKIWQLLASPWAGTNADWIELTVGTIGTTVQAWDADLDAIAALAHTKGNIIVGGAAAWTALAVGANTTQLVADSTQASGVRWATADGPRVSTFVLGIGTPLVVGTDVTNWLTMSKAGTFTRVDIVAKTAPTGADMIIDIKKSSNGGASFTSLWNITPANRPTILDGVKTGAQTVFDTAAFAAGDILRCDVIQVGSTIAGQNVTVQLLGTMAQ